MRIFVQLLTDFNFVWILQSFLSWYCVYWFRAYITLLRQKLKTDLWAFCDNLLCCCNNIFMRGAYRSSLWFLSRLPDWEKFFTHRLITFFRWRHPQTVLRFKASLGFHDPFPMSEVSRSNKDELFYCLRHFFAVLSDMRFSFAAELLTHTRINNAVQLCKTRCSRILFMYYIRSN